MTANGGQQKPRGPQDLYDPMYAKLRAFWSLCAARRAAKKDQRRRRKQRG